MKASSREVFIKIQNIKEIINVLVEIEKTQNKINSIIPQIEELKEKEEVILEHWLTQLEEIEDGIEHLTL